MTDQHANKPPALPDPLSIELGELANIAAAELAASPELLSENLSQYLRAILNVKSLPDDRRLTEERGQLFAGLTLKQYLRTRPTKREDQLKDTQDNVAIAAAFLRAMSTEQIIEETGVTPRQFSTRMWGGVVLEVHRKCKLFAVKAAYDAFLDGEGTDYVELLLTQELSRKELNNDLGIELGTVPQFPGLETITISPPLPRRMFLASMVATELPPAADDDEPAPQPDSSLEDASSPELEPAVVAEPEPVVEEPTEEQAIELAVDSPAELPSADEPTAEVVIDEVDDAAAVTPPVAEPTDPPRIEKIYPPEMIRSALQLVLERHMPADQATLNSLVDRFSAAVESPDNEVAFVRASGILRKVLIGSLKFAVHPGPSTVLGTYDYTFLDVNFVLSFLSDDLVAERQAFDEPRKQAMQTKIAKVLGDIHMATRRR